MRLNIKYATLQFGYWIDYLLVSSFATVLLISRGFSASDVGYVTTLGAVLAMLLQTYTSALADKSKKITVKHIIGALILGAIASGVLMWMFPDVHAATFAGMAVAFGLTTTLSPLLTALCLKYNKMGYKVNFGIARSLGSMGYASAGYAAGQITGAFGVEIIIPIFIFIYVVSFVILISMEKIKLSESPKYGTADEQNNEQKKISPSDIEKGRRITDETPSGLIQFFLKYPRYDVFLISVMMIYFMQMVLGTYMIYFVRGYGGTEAEMGLVLSVTAFSEMPAVALGMFFLRKTSAGTLLRISGVASAIKFISMIFITHIQVFIGLQVIHFFFSGLYMVSSVYYADSIVDRADAVKAQGLLAVGLSGFAGIIANISAGYLLEVTTTKNISIIGGAVATLGMILMFLATGDMIPKKRIIASKESTGR
ncbi:MFS transporter [Butyrivibrio sp. JL13D10]|uniref:MFS transporter n=1 Tax=Butyrivibrio sp. JL13D10 TaxID=3236815 RepID=UPI0038B44799